MLLDARTEPRAVNHINAVANYPHDAQNDNRMPVEIEEQSNPRQTYAPALQQGSGDMVTAD